MNYIRVILCCLVVHNLLLAADVNLIPTLPAHLLKIKSGDLSDLREALIKIRGPNNCPNNCFFLAKSVIHYLETGEIKPAETRVQTFDENDVLEGIPVLTDKIYIKSKTKTGNINLPCNIYQLSYMRLKAQLYSSDINQLLQSRFYKDRGIECSEKSVQMIPTDIHRIGEYQELFEEKLIYESQTNPYNLSFGIICISRIQYDNLILPGHRIIYIANASNGHLYFIDLQKHDGLTGIGDPFVTFRKDYKFLNSGLNQIDFDLDCFSRYVFYLPIGPLVHTSAS